MREAEAVRLLQDLIRVGTVKQVDYANYVARVKTGGNTTDWIRWGAQRAGDATTWWAPSVGEMVVILSPGGDLENAFIAFSLYGAGALPPGTGRASVTKWPDGAMEGYDPASGVKTISGIKNALIDASGTLMMNLSRVIINADVVINGAVTQGGGKMSSNGVVVDSHVHSGVQGGGSKTGGPQ